MTPIATIGYEGATLESFLTALRDAGVELVVDVRAVTSSRRPGFSKRQLAAELERAGIEYLHLRGLGTPAEGRSAARAGRHAEMRRVFLEHLCTPEARAAMAELEEVVERGKRLALLCYEADAAHCHRSIVAADLEARHGVAVEHLAPLLT
jgi:uncharacterized protein (DUF488 family)